MTSATNRAVDTLNTIGNPSLKRLPLLGLERAGEDSQGRRIYQIKDSSNRYHAYLEGGQIKWESSEPVNPKELDEVIRFSIKSGRSLLINAGTHGTEKGKSVGNKISLGDTKTLLKTAEKISKNKAALNVALHAVSANCPPLTHEDLPTIDIIDAWCFSSEDDAKNYTLSSRIKKYVKEVLSEMGFTFEPLSLDKLKETLKERYRQESRIHYLHSNEKDEDVCASFINLAILTHQERRDNSQEGKPVNSRDSYHSSFEALYEVKENIALSDVFSSRGNEPPKKHLLVTGRAGIGKSTLCQYIANAWIDPERRRNLLGWGEQFEVVVWIKLRDLISYAKARNLYEAIALLYSLEAEEALEEGLKTGQIPRVAQDIQNFLEPLEQKGKVLYLIDGYDEGVESLKDKFFSHLIYQLRSKSNWIITTRPHWFTLRDEEDVRHLEILGFSDDNIQVYVERFFEVFREELNSQKEKEELLEFLNNQPNVRAVARIPIVLEILCGLFLDKKLVASSLQTLTDVYSAMLLNMLRRYIRDKRIKKPSGRLEGLVSQLQFPQSLSYLERTAFEAMQRPPITFYPSSFLPPEVSVDSENDFLDEVFALGFTKKIKEHSNRFEEEHQFLHLTFQEYFAARYLARAILQDIPVNGSTWQHFVQQHKFNNRFSIVFQFTAGLLVSHQNKLEELLKVIIEEPNSVLGLHEYALAAHCLDEVSVDFRSEAQGQIVKFVGQIIRSYGNKPYRDEDCLLKLLKGVRHIYEQGAVDFLIEQAKQGNKNAIGGLGRLGVQNSNIIQIYTQLLQNPDVWVRSAIARTLDEVEPEDPAAIQLLIQLLQDPESYVRGVATLALGNLKPQDPAVILALIQLFRDPDEDVRRKAFWILTDLKPQDPAVIQAFIQLLQDSDKDVCLSAVYALRTIKPQDPVVIEAIVQLLKNENEDIRRTVTGVFAGLNPQDSVDVQALVQLSKSSKRSVRIRGAVSLGRIESEDPLVVQALIKLLQDPSKSVRRTAVFSLGRIESEDPLVVQALIQLLQDPSKSVRKAIIFSLREIGSQDSTVIQPMVRFLQNPDKSMRRAAISALGKIKAQDSIAIQALSQLLEDPDEDICKDAISALGEIGSQDSTAIQLLVRFLQNPDKSMRRAAISALGKIKAQASIAIQALVQLIEDPNEDICKDATSALREIEPQDLVAIQRLIQLIEGPDYGVRLKAVSILERVKLQDLTIIADIIRIFLNSDDDRKIFIPMIEKISIYHFLSKASIHHVKEFAIIFAVLIYLQSKFCVIEGSTVCLEEEGVLMSIEIDEKEVFSFTQYLKELVENPKQFFEKNSKGVNSETFYGDLT